MVGTPNQAFDELWSGSFRNVHVMQSDIFKYMHASIKSTLDNINNSLIRDEYMLKVYSQYFILAVRFKLTVHEITNTNLTKLYKYVKYG